MGLSKTRGQKHTVETVLPTVLEIKEEFPKMGARSLTQALRVDHGIAVPEFVLIHEYMRTLWKVDILPGQLYWTYFTVLSPRL